MKEFIDKLIERLEKKSFRYFNEGYGSDSVIKETDAISIVNQLAEEHKGGWIPCSERLPETNESVLCWAKSTARGGDVCFVGSCHNGFWFLQSSADTHSFPGQYVIVAWQSIQPYKAEEPQWKQAMMNTFLARK